MKKKNNKFVGKREMQVLCEFYNAVEELLSSFQKEEEEEYVFSERDISISHDSPHYNKISSLRDLILSLDENNIDLKIKSLLSGDFSWNLKRRYQKNYTECQRLAVIMYFSIGYENARELLLGMYGEIDFEIISLLFNEFDVKKTDSDTETTFFGKDAKSIEAFRKFLFSNKKDPNNTMRLLLKGDLSEITVNFDYFFNSIEHIIQELGTNMNRNKVVTLLKERYISREVRNPELNGNVLDEMISSFRHSVDIDDSDGKIIDQNMDAYNKKLKTKSRSSIKKVDIPNVGEYSFEMIPLKDARNLVMGYRAGNCFRLNGDAFMLFNNFLTNPHMRLLSISTEEYKDFGMVLLMRNGNVLIAQGIETSKRAPQSILGRKLYLAVCDAIKHIMSEMNEDDEIVASIIGLTNENTIYYNQNLLPFIVNPLIDNSHQYYNGIDSYQGLVSLKDGKYLSDIKLFVPEKLYGDRNTIIWRRDSSTDHSSYEYREIEKILISLRFARFKKISEEEMFSFYCNLTKKEEAYTICTLDWYITVFVDGTIDSLVNSTDPDVIEEFNRELARVEGKGRAF